MTGLIIIIAAVLLALGIVAWRVYSASRSSAGGSPPGPATTPVAHGGHYHARFSVGNALGRVLEWLPLLLLLSILFGCVRCSPGHPPPPRNVGAVYAAVVAQPARTCDQPSQNVTVPGGGKEWSEWVYPRGQCDAHANPGPDSGLYLTQCKYGDGEPVDWTAAACADFTAVRFKKIQKGNPDTDPEPLELDVWFTLRP